MQVTDVVDFETYYREHAERRPTAGDPSDPGYYGDATYSTGDPDTAEMLPCPHSNSDGSANLGAMRIELGGRYVLLSDNFVHFAAKSAPREHFETGMGIRGRKWKHPDWVMNEFREWLAGLGGGAPVPDFVAAIPPDPLRKRGCS
jgi:hypothetical protein